MEERLARVGRTAWWLTGVALVIVLVGLLGWFVRVIFPPLLLASVLVFLLNPIVSRLERRGLPRLLGTLAAFLMVLAGFAMLGALLYPLISSQAADVSDRWPELRRDAEDWIDDVSRRSKRDDWPIELPSVAEIEDETAPAEDQELSEQVATLREYLTRAFHIGIIFVLGPFLAFYLLVDLPDVRKRIEELIPERNHEEVMFLARRLGATIGGFFRGQFAVALIVGVMASVGLWIIGLPLWLVVGMIAGLFNMVPLIGPYIGAVPGILVALATRDVKTAILVAVVMTVVQQIDNHFITPTVMRRAVQLHPAAVMMALLAWGTIGGFLGLLLAVPLTATLKIVGGHFWRKWVVGVSVPGLDRPYPDRGEGAREDLPNEELPAVEGDAAEATETTADPVTPSGAVSGRDGPGVPAHPVGAGPTVRRSLPPDA